MQRSNACVFNGEMGIFQKKQTVETNNLLKRLKQIYNLSLLYTLNII